MKLIEQQVLPSILNQQFDEVVVVGDFHAGEGYTYLNIPPMTKTTNDALVKRDCGTLAASSDILFYLSDDHGILPGPNDEQVGNIIREYSAKHQPWDVLIPRRFAEHPEEGLVRINNGEQQGYCGGHGGIFRRRVIQDRPWSAQTHHRLWDLYSSQAMQKAGFQFVANPPIGIIDLEPQNRPWQ